MDAVAEDSARLEGEGEGSASVCLPPARLWEPGAKVQKATCDLSGNLTYRRFPTHTHTAAAHQRRRAFSKKGRVALGRGEPSTA